MKTNMKRISIAAATLLTTIAATAQETYENARLVAEDLNGTARYVGMGGAMDALGADISTIGTNPAGIGLFRSSSARLSFGFVSQQDASKFAGESPTKMSFDQAGFVYSCRMSEKSFVNFAFNYHKSTNFRNILSAAGALSGASQNKLSYMKHKYGLVNGSSLTYNQVDYLYLMLDEDDNSGMSQYYDASDYNFTRASTGYIGEYDFNISGNINNRIYLGMTIGIHDVNYSAYSEYAESLVNASGTSDGGMVLADNRVISGTGFNIKFGAIFRPIETSPFRIGLSIATPTWYDLTTSNSTQLWDINGGQADLSNSISESYDFKLYTPWKFGISAGTTFGTFLAIGAGYEYSNYSNLDTRVNDGYYDYYDYIESSSSDRAMNVHTDKTLKGVSTLKLGLELKPDANMAVRLGYNYVSPMYNKYGQKDYTIHSNGTYYSSATDYTNWKATNRITCGFGYTCKKFTFDVAYQYSVTNGDFKPFSDFVATGTDDGDCFSVASTEVSNKRHQMIFTLGYAF